MSIPDRPDPDEIITSAWGDWVHDALVPRVGGTQTWVPTWGNPFSTVTKTVVEAKYVREGPVVTFWLDLVATSGTSGGVGEIYVTLPVPAVGHAASSIIGNGYYYDGTNYLLAAAAVPPAGDRFWLTVSTGTIGANPSRGIVTGNVERVTGRYRVA